MATSESIPLSNTTTGIGNRPISYVPMSNPNGTVTFKPVAIPQTYPYTTSASVSPGPSSTALSSSSNFDDSSTKSLNPGTIAGIVLAGLGVLAAVVGLLVLWWRRRERARRMRRAFVSGGQSVEGKGGLGLRWLTCAGGGNKEQYGDESHLTEMGGRRERKRSGSSSLSMSKIGGGGGGGGGGGVDGDGDEEVGDDFYYAGGGRGLGGLKAVKAGEGVRRVEDFVVLPALTLGDPFVDSKV